MKKSIKLLLIILIILIIVLLVGGILTYSEDCWDNGHGETCQTKIFGIIMSEAVTMDNQTIVGGCGGVYYPYWQECCDNWAKENNIVHIMCVGNWTVEDNSCVWKCG